MTIDIALPFYGDVDFMKQTVASVLGQSDPDWRMIVVDDGFPDESLPGWFANFQKCLGLLSAEFCLVMGADDLLESNFVAVVNDTIRKNPKVSMIHPGVKVIDELNREISTRSDQVKANIREPQAVTEVLSGESLATSLMKGNWMYFPAITWRTKKIQEIGFRPGFSVCQDLGLAMDVIMQGGKMALIDDEIFRYRRHTASDSSLKAFNGERFLDERKFFKVMSADLRSIGWNKAAKAAQMHWTSRLHAASLIPACIARGRNPWILVKHLFSLG
jgi:glycosyltransferase involved in cell wall biosynthesis